MTAIKIQRNYPDEQIYDALTHFIENKSEVLVDKYGRTGHLVNRGIYYVFQPEEITDESASIFDRSIPVDYKRKTIELEIPQTFSISEETEDEKKKREQEEKEKNTKKTEQKEEVLTDYNEILEKVESQMALFTDETPVGPGETNWFRHSRMLIGILTEFHQIPIAEISDHVLYHSLDTLSVKEKYIIIENIHELDENATKFERKIKEYFENKTVFYENIKGYVVANVDKYTIYMKNANNVWQQAHKEDERKFLDSLKRFIVPKQNMSKYVGFMHPFKGKEMVFKMKDITQKRNNKGAWCNKAQKGDIMNILNALLDETVYTIENVDEIKAEKKGRKSKQSEFRKCVYKMGDDVYVENREYERKCITKLGLCILLEILLRHFNESGKEKTYFFDPEIAVLNNIVNI